MLVRSPKLLIAYNKPSLSEPAGALSKILSAISVPVVILLASISIACILDMAASVILAKSMVAYTASNSFILATI